jgi:transcriptional antiterminator NusG
MTDEKAASDEAIEPNAVSESSAEVADVAAPEVAEPEVAEPVAVADDQPAAEAVEASAVEASAVEETTVETAGDETAGDETSGEDDGDAEKESTIEDAAQLSPEELEFSADEIVTDEDLLDEDDDEDEDASPIEEFVEPVKAVEQDLNMEWYILKVQVNRENSVCDALKRQVKVAGMESHFGDILVPTEDVREFNKAGKQRITKRKLYPGYIVVNMAIDDDSWFLVRDTSGIGDFAGAAGRPAPLSTEEINRIISTTRPEEAEDSEESIKTAIPFKVGDRVRVKEGYFQNYEGDISNVDERNGRIEVMINIFGRPNPVDMDHWHVEKI